MDPQKALLDLPAKNLRRILKSLNEVRRHSSEGADIKVPLVSLHLRSGQSLSGWIIDLADDEQRECVLFQQNDQGSNTPSMDLLYIEMPSIEAISIYNSGPLLPTLSFGRIAAASVAEPVSRLKAAQRADELGRGVSEFLDYALTFDVSWPGIAEQPERLSRLVASLVDASGALRDIGRDAIGKEALKKLTQVRWQWDATPSVAWEGSVVLVRLSDKGPDRGSIQKAIISGLE